MSTARVFVDATVLLSRTQRDWLFHARVVTKGSMFSLQTSEDVLNETLARLRDRNPRWDGGVFSQIRKNVWDVFDEVLTDFRGDVEFPGEDTGGVHVHAAALSADSTMLLTADAGFLKLRELADHRMPYEPLEPDSFFVLLDDSSPRQTLEMVQRQINFRAARDEKPDLANRLRRAQCPLFAERVEERIAQLAGPRALRVFLASRDSGS